MTGRGWKMNGAAKKKKKNRSGESWGRNGSRRENRLRCRSMFKSVLSLSLSPSVCWAAVLQYTVASLTCLSSLSPPPPAALLTKQREKKSKSEVGPAAATVLFFYIMNSVNPQELSLDLLRAKMPNQKGITWHHVLIVNTVSEVDSWTGLASRRHVNSPGWLRNCVDEWEKVQGFKWKFKSPQIPFLVSQKERSTYTLTTKPLNDFNRRDSWRRSEPRAILLLTVIIPSNLTLSFPRRVDVLICLTEVYALKYFCRNFY